MTYESLDEVGTRDPMLSIARLRRAGELYAGELDLKDPRVSPIYGELRGLGPITVLVGTRDLLLHDSRRLRDLAEAAGIQVTYHEEAGPHPRVADSPSARGAPGPGSDRRVDP